MKSAMLVGYFGMSNVGDDAFLAINALYAKEICGVEKVFVTGCAPLETYGVPNTPLQFWRNFTQFGLGRLKAKLLCKNVDHVIFGGGSLFHSTGIINIYESYLDRAGKGPHFAVGVSVGPFKDSGAEEACARLLKRLSFIGVRDQESLERAQNIAPQANVCLTFDLAPLFVNRFHQVSQEIKKGRRLGISLCCFRNFGGTDHAENLFVSEVAKAINSEFVSLNFDEIVLLDCNSDSRMGDAVIHSKLRTLLNTRIPIKNIKYKNDPVSFLRELEANSFTIAMRLHAAIFSYCVGLPTVILSYHEKCDEWAKMISLPSRQSLAINSMTSEKLIDSMVATLERSGSSTTLDRAVAIKRSESNWHWLSCASPTCV